MPATGWGEKDGTVTNSERRISRQRAFLPAPGEARPDWWIVGEVARRLGWGEAFDFDSAAAIYREHAALSGFENDGRRAFDIGAQAALSDAAYDALAPVQWPLPAAGGVMAPARMFAAGGFVTDTGRAIFIAVESRRSRPSVDAAFPLHLNTGRVRDHWHTMTRTGKSPRLSVHIGEAFCAIHPSDASVRGIEPASLVRVKSPRGEIVVRALVSADQAEGAVFVPMHWSGQFSADARVGKLLPPATDPVSGQPGLKFAAVEVMPFAAAWYGFAITRERPAVIDAAYWSAARIKGGWKLEVAGMEAPADWPAFAATAIGDAAAGTTWQSYEDAGAGVYRYAALSAGQVVGAVFLGRKPVEVSRAWMAGLFAEAEAPEAYAQDLLAGRAGNGRPDPGATVCSCFAIGINQIVAAISEPGGASVDAVGKRLGAGTNCGSCRAEIQTIISANLAGEPEALTRAG